MNTTRHAFFLITPREIKYKAKTAIDTFFWRTKVDEKKRTAFKGNK
jgi:hypothetical protein